MTLISKHGAYILGKPRPGLQLALHAVDRVASRANGPREHAHLMNDNVLIIH
jgi:hypothetical protein